MVRRFVSRVDAEDNRTDPVTTPARQAAVDFQQRFFQSTIDALPAQIAIVRERGEIVAVNRAWREGCGCRHARIVRGQVGDGYLEHLDDAVASEIQAVLSGAQDAYFIEYQDHEHGGCWFSLRITPLDDFVTRYALVTHENITRRVEAEQARSETGQTLDTLAQAAPLAIIALDTANRITAWNPAAEEMFGWTKAEVLGTFNPIVPETAVPQFLDIVANLDNNAVDLTDVELQRQRKDGVVLDVSSSIAALRTADGQIRGSMAVLTDITERKRAQEAQRFLAEVSDLLAGSIDYETTLTQVAQMAVPRLADICMVHLLDEDMTIHRLAIAHVDPERQEVAQQLKDHGKLQMNGTWGVPVVLRTGEPVVYSDMDNRLWDADNERLEHIDMLRNLGMSSLMVVPLIARDQTIGTLAFAASNSGHVYTDSDLEMARELARRAATAIDNARLHHEVRRAELRLRTLVEHVPAASYTALADNLTAMTYVSPQMAKPDGPTAEDLINDPDLWTSFLHPDDIERVQKTLADCTTSGEPLAVEYRIVNSDGKVTWLYDRATLIRDERGQPLFWQGICVDITERKELEERLTHQAFHDALTGLPNRALFLDRVQHARGRVRHRHEGIAVLFLDLDNFKFVNDSLGHSVGDELLVAVAERLTDCLAGGDSAARLGGDEFAILLEDLADWAVATDTAERIGAAFQAPFSLSGREIFISPSIGIAIGARLETSAEDLLRDADAAMYRAKRNGKARYEVFDPSLTVHALQRFELENDLRGAIGRGEFRLHYQPIVHLANGETIGIEALVRWQHPLHGLMPPLDFIPIAEDTGLIVPIGLWVLQEACQQVSAWNRQREGRRPLELGVNLSRRQFHDPDLSVHLAAAIDASGLNPHLLNLEITESVMIEDESMASETLQRLKALGVQLVIDDFGTGYSSLGMLRNFPVDVLKIDRGFVNRLATNADDRVVVSGIISLAHALHLLVVAEGIETLEQLNHLKALGCDFAQGFFIGRPLPADELSGAVIASRIP